VRVGKLDDYWRGACKTQYLPDQRRDREILLPLGCRTLGRDLARRDRQQGGTGSDIGQGRCTRFGQCSSQLLELDGRPICQLEMRSMLELIDDGIKRAVGMVQRALISDLDVRLCCVVLQKDLANTRLSDAGFSAQKRDLASVGFGSLRDGVARILRSANFRIVASVSCADDFLSSKVQPHHPLFLIVHMAMIST
jgi:hypothetical protein